MPEEYSKEIGIEVPKEIESEIAFDTKVRELTIIDRCKEGRRFNKRTIKLNKSFEDFIDNVKESVTKLFDESVATTVINQLIQRHDEIIDSLDDCVSDDNFDERKKQKILVNKYSTDELHEAVVIGGKPTFVIFNKENRVEFRDDISEYERIIVPPGYNEFPHEAYGFKDKDEIESIYKEASVLSIDDIFTRVLQTISKFIDQDRNKLSLIATSIILTYFQDKFGTIYYLYLVGDNGSGKSSIGEVIDYLAYRCSKLTSPTPAVLFRRMGSVEAGQCTLVLDEAEGIDGNTEIMNILKEGYSYRGRVMRTVEVNGEYVTKSYHAFGFKVIIAENTFTLRSAKGVNDRSFVIQCIIGEPQYDIKDALNPANFGDENDKHYQLNKELTHLRKLMLMFRLIHFNDRIPDIDININGRNGELCKPTLRLFHGGSHFEEIKQTLQYFIDERASNREDGFEKKLLSILHKVAVINNINKISIRSFFEDYVYKEIPGSKIEINGSILSYESLDCNKISTSRVTKALYEKDGVQKPVHEKDGNYYVFNKEKIESIYQMKRKANQQIMVSPK